MYSTRPLSWLTREYHDVMRLCRVGYTALQIGINHASKRWGSGSIDRETYYRLLPHVDFPGLDKNGGLPIASLFLAVVLKVPDFEPNLIPVRMMRRHDLVGWWEKMLRPSDMTNEEFGIVVSQPELLIKHGYQMLYGPYYFEPDCSREFAACVSMVGAGVAGLVTTRPCSLCKFRRSVYRSGRCDLCSMSKSVVSPNQLDQQAARTRKRRRILQAGNSSLVELVIPDSQEPAERSLASLLDSMNRRSPEYRAWAKRVRDALALAPRIRSQLPDNFTRLHQQVQWRELRRVIDPLEFDYAVWPEKIQAAQRWLDAEAEVSSRRKVAGPTRSTTEKAARARSLLRSGLSRSEVATEMGLSLSHLSHILRRTEGLTGSG